MKNSAPKSNLHFADVCCKVFGHNYKKSRTVTSYITEYRCTRCNAEATTDEKGNLLKLTPQLKDINETLIYLCKKKRSAAASI
ncbi:DUF1660 family phage protein [Abyssalbus ytuae]|uniref:DUF1660 family phage protein n=1 Tax=Abyssalbus ytuae TaxID=2926907 RepID=A0A9E7CV64_9FLAO|nr:DUF1660 family phage protein [Abyssalbus ytuae]UOB19452.1 DUF1660 family phage protein [Abyssalbus ytuae]